MCVFVGGAKEGARRCKCLLWAGNCGRIRYFDWDIDIISEEGKSRSGK